MSYTRLNPPARLKLGSNNLTGMFCPGYITASGNYVNFCIPFAPPLGYTSMSVSGINTVSLWTSSGPISSSVIDTTYSKLLNKCDYSFTVELKFSTTQTASRICTVGLYGLIITFS